MKMEVELKIIKSGQKQKNPKQIENLKIFLKRLKFMLKLATKNY